MGQHLIQDATVERAMWWNFAAEQSDLRWEEVEDGVLVTSDTRTDQDLATMYAGYSEDPDPNWRPPLSPGIREHLGHLKQFRDTVRSGGTPTAAQAYHVMADIIDWLRLQEDRL